MKHSGLLGLLIFHIKNEVDAALKCGKAVSLPRAQLGGTSEQNTCCSGG